MVGILFQWSFRRIISKIYGTLTSKEILFKSLMFIFKQRQADVSWLREKSLVGGLINAFYRCQRAKKPPSSYLWGSPYLYEAFPMVLALLAGRWVKKFRFFNQIDRGAKMDATERYQGCQIDLHITISVGNVTWKYKKLILGSVHFQCLARPQALSFIQKQENHRHTHR